MYLSKLLYFVPFATFVVKLPSFLLIAALSWWNTPVRKDHMPSQVWIAPSSNWICTSF